MFVFQLFSVILIVPCTWTLNAIEDKFLSSELMDIFDDISEKIGTGQLKREALAASDETKQSASIYIPIDLTRANHYWTRKRGRDQSTTDSSLEQDISYYPTRNPIQYRKKREALKKIMDFDKVSFRTKRSLEKVVDIDKQIRSGDGAGSGEIPKTSMKPRKYEEKQEENVESRVDQKILKR